MFVGKNQVKCSRIRRIRMFFNPSKHMNPTDSRCVLFNITYKYANPNGFIRFQEVISIYILSELSVICRSLSVN